MLRWWDDPDWMHDTVTEKPERLNQPLERLREELTRQLKAEAREGEPSDN